jgi:flagellum-specific peptidoglycan hydrolase FlgJ
MRKMKLIILAIFLTLKLQAPEYHTFFIAEAKRINYIGLNDIDFLLKKYHVKYPKTVKAQICLETAYLKSFVCKANKNLFGMRYAKGRKTTAISEQNSLAVYESYEKSIEDYKIWQDLYYKSGDYFAFLKRIGYATDKKYIEKLKQLSKI